MIGSQYWAGSNFSAFQLVSYQRSIANFVEILTGKSIPVNYATQGDSKTDGETITISSDINESTLDSVVGLALHEASHILLTDFDIVRGFPKELARISKNSIHYSDNSLCFSLFNFVEDRRIDNFVYTSSPGYRTYYKEMYERYFFSEEVDKILKTSFKTPTKQSYLCRIINLFNKNNDLSTLPALGDVYNVVDIDNIGRLKSSRDSLDIAIEIYNLIKPHIVEGENEVTQSEGLNKQEKFLRGQVKKETLTQKKVKEIQKVAKLDFKEKDIDGTNVLDLKLDSNLIKSVGLGYINFRPSIQDLNMSYINEGIRLGKKLTKKLQLLNDSKQEKISYKTRGQLDIKRLPLYSSESNIFHTINQHQTQQNDFHLSVDLSGSMKGSKFERSLKLATALCYCSLKIKDFNFSLSFRTTSLQSKHRTILINAFDSRKNTLRDISLLRGLEPAGGTPEGVLLEYVSKKLPKNSYIFSITDGAPNYKSSFEESSNHTKKCVNRIGKTGYKLVSFFVKGTYDKEIARKNFVETYKKNGYFIDINNINEVSKSINNILLKSVL